MDHPQKVFTLDEANALLGQVQPLVQQLRHLHESIRRTNHQIDEGVAKLAAGNGYPLQEVRKQIEELTKHQLNLIQAFQSALDQLESLGCLLKDVENGLVDFYTMRDGELVLLCWKLGERRIGFWHSLEEGYASRRPIG